MKGLRVALLLALFCVGVALCSGIFAGSSTHALNVAGEALVVGGSSCGDFFAGVAAGLVIGSFLGCVICPLAAAIAGGIAVACA